MNQGHEYSTPGVWGRLSEHLRSLTLSTVLLRPFLFIMAYDIFVYHPISRSEFGGNVSFGDRGRITGSPCYREYSLGGRTVLQTAPALAYFRCSTLIFSELALDPFCG